MTWKTGEKREKRKVGPAVGPWMMAGMEALAWPANTIKRELKHSAECSINH
jgi:hypothetical protein